MPRTAKRVRVKPDRNGLGTRLREIIRGRGLTAYAVAKSAGLDPGVVQRWLTGQRDIRLATAEAIASALGLRLVESGVRRKGRDPRPTDVEDAGSLGATPKAALKGRDPRPSDMVDAGIDRASDGVGAVEEQRDNNGGDADEFAIDLAPEAADPDTK